MAESPTLYLLLGLPGSGKTTAAKEISKITGAVHLSSDKFRLSLFEKPQFTQAEHDALYKMLDYMCELLLQSGTSVVYDANLNRLSHRQDKYNLAKKLFVKQELFWLKVLKETAKKRRIASQDTSLVPKHESPTDMFDRIAGVFEAPLKTETFTELDGTRITHDYMKKMLLLASNKS